jgi:hypothetical protein
MLYLGSIYGLNLRGGLGRAVMTETGPNDAGRVIWALGTSFFSSFMFLSILTNDLCCI